MGVKNLQKLLLEFAPNAIKTTNINDYKNKIIAMDTSILIYQYVIAIRNTGADLTNESGYMTSHIHGILSKALSLLEIGINPIFIFDGKPPSIKNNTLKDRKNIRTKATEKMETTEDNDEKIKLFKRSAVITSKHLNECKEILILMGLPIISAPEEADPQCAKLVMEGHAYACGSEDMDLLAFGTNRLLRNLSVSKKKQGVVELSLDKILKELEISHDQFIDLCILLGCDYTDTIGGIGMKRALIIIKQYGSIDEFLKKDDKIKSGFYKIPKNFDYQSARQYFKNPPIQKITKIDIVRKSPDYTKLIEVLVEKYDFNLNKTTKYINRLKKTYGTCTEIKAIKPLGNDLEKIFKKTKKSEFKTII